MARYTYAVLSTATAGREEEFRNWYSGQHLDDVARLLGVVTARLLVPDIQMSGGLGVPQFSALALYEFESDAPQAAIDAMFAKAGTDAMPLTDAMDMSGFFQVIAHEVRLIG